MHRRLSELSSKAIEMQAAIAASRAQNRMAWNRLAEEGSVFAKVATDEECRNALDTLDGRGWLPKSVQGLDVLCLASGGGWQAILYAAAGARVTVVDLSAAMLKLDEREATRRGLHVRLVEASMDDLGVLDEAAFDIVHQPVSTCYVPNVVTVYQEVVRLLRPGGLYISQHKQPTSLQVTHRDDRDRYVLGIEFNHQGPLPTVPDRSYRETGTVEFLHPLEELVGGLCRAGFTIEDLVEPIRADAAAAPGQIGHRGRYVPPYLRIKARRMAREAQSSNRLWMP